VSLGSGFRGGLFFASLFLGALSGKLLAGLAAFVHSPIAIDPVAAAVVGMGAFAVAVIGGPLTMAFLALETTGDFGLAGVVLAAAVVSGLTVREIFGYSFSTWRFHLRGETIRSAHDVGWMRSLTVGRMMRHDIRTVSSQATIAEFRAAFPLGSTQRVICIDPEGRYFGMVLVPEAYAPERDKDADTTPIGSILRYPDDVLIPSMNVKEAVTAFDRSESEALAVVDGPSTRVVVGLLTEAHVMRRYAEELDQVRRGMSGEP
jgi:CIC family chloride channel protein